MHIQKQSLQHFWLQQILDIRNTEAFKNNKQLPLSRIKRIVKADKDVKMVSAEVPLFMAKACEIFILELTLRSWMLTEENERCTLQNHDIAKAIQKKHVLHFLTNLVHSDQLQLYEHQGIHDGKEGNQAYLSHVATSMENTQTCVAEMVTTNNQIPQPQMMLMHFDPFTYKFFELEQETKSGKEENLASLFDAAGSKENTMTNMAMSTSTSMEVKMENMGEMEAPNQELPQPRMMLSDFDPFQYNYFQPE
ncbi:hypothetical protein Lal_00005867, partial [Lupinus albus]